MKRKWVAAALAAGLFAVGACGDDDGDGGDGGDEPTGKSTEEVCTDVEAAIGEMETAVQAAVADATAAAESGDELAALAAWEDLQGAIETLAGDLRTSAGEAEEQETADTLNTAADDIDTFVENFDIQAIESGEFPDTTALDESTAAVNEMCGIA